MRVVKVFRNGRSQAVRIPNEYQFDTDEVVVNKIGGAVMIFPREKSWEVFAEGLAMFTEDFMESRNQPRDSGRRKAL